MIQKLDRKIPVSESFLKKSLEADIHRCSSKQLFLKSLPILQEITCVAVFFNKVARPQNCNFNKKDSL